MKISLEDVILDTGVMVSNMKNRDTEYLKFYLAIIKSQLSELECHTKAIDEEIYIRENTVKINGLKGKYDEENKRILEELDI